MVQVVEEVEEVHLETSFQNRLASSGWKELAKDSLNADGSREMRDWKESRNSFGSCRGSLCKNQEIEPLSVAVPRTAMPQLTCYADRHPAL